MQESKNKDNAVEVMQDGTKIYLQLENPDEAGNTIDIINIASNMAKRRKIYKYLAAIMVVVGIVIGLIWVAIEVFIGNNSYAQAVINLQYDGIEKGLDPNGVTLDVNMMKSPVVLSEALNQLDIPAAYLEEVRQNITIEGVVPEDVVKRITIIQEMSVKDAKNYEKLLDISYFPSQYVVTLQRIKGINEDNTADLLNAILDSYRDYFLETYANTAVLSVSANLISYENYDYLEAIDMFATQIDIMLQYVKERRAQDSGFRSVKTGLSFGDIISALEMVRSVDLDNLAAYVENTCLTKNKETQIEYLNYQIRQYNRSLAELQVRQSTIEDTIATYQKDPVVIVSNQESTQELSQTNEYYDSLIQQKLDITTQIASVNTKLNKCYALLNSISAINRNNKQSEFDYADEKLADIAETLSKWVTLVEDTTEEYYQTALFSNAVTVAVPAKYQQAGGLMAIAKKMIVCVGAMVVLLLFVWGIDGLSTEIKYMRMRKN